MKRQNQQSVQHIETLRCGLVSLWLAGLLALAILCPRASGAEVPAAAHFRKNAQPILEKYCFDCHADGVNKGGVAFDEINPDQPPAESRTLWWRALKNVRAGM